MLAFAKKYNNGVGGGNGLSADSWKSDVLNTPKNGFFADLIGNDIDLVKQQFNTIDQWAKESGATTAEVFSAKVRSLLVGFYQQVLINTNP